MAKKNRVVYEVFKNSWYTKNATKRELKRKARQRRVTLARLQQLQDGNLEGGRQCQTLS